LTYLLSQTNIDVNIKGKDGNTILHYVCDNISKLSIEIYQYLIETVGCDVSVQNNNKDTPIHRALDRFDPNKGGDISVLQYLLDQSGVNADIKGRNGNTILHYACININKLPLEIFKLLIETVGCDVNAQDNNNETPLHNAIRRFNPHDGGDITTFTYLLSQKGVDPNIKGRNGYTLLHYACEKIYYCPLEIFKILIETQCFDVNAQEDDKDTPLHNAIHRFDPNDDEYDEDEDEEIPVLTALMYLLSRKDVNANIKGDCGYTILHTACDKINKLPLDVFKLLIETIGFDINAQDNNNDTPLHHAFHRFYPRKCGNIAVLTYLLSQNNVNLNVKGKQGFNLLHLTCINNLPSYKRSVEREAKCDTTLCQIVELIAERCILEVLDETTPFEATTTM
jgi:ankyrin repeat protein